MSELRLPLGKRCTKCGEWKLLGEYPKGHNRCKECTNEYKRQWKRDNPERVRASRNKPDNRQRKLEADRQYYQRNREKAREQGRRWYEANKRSAIDRASQWYRENKNRKQEYDRRYIKENAERVLAAKRAYRARKGASEGSFTIDEWLELCAKHNYTCLCCGEAKSLEADHVIPLSKGGSSDIGNIQPLCRSCNASKNTQVIDYR